MSDQASDQPPPERVTKKSYKKKPKPKPAEGANPADEPQGENEAKVSNVTHTGDMTASTIVADGENVTITPDDSPCVNCAGNGEAPCPKCGSCGKVDTDESGEDNQFSTEDEAALKESLAKKAEEPAPEPEPVEANRFQQPFLGALRHFDEFGGRDDVSQDRKDEAEGALITIRDLYNRLEGCETKADAIQIAKRVKADSLAKPHGKVFTQQGVRKACDLVREVLNDLKE